jgi:hypothetical protein
MSNTVRVVYIMGFARSGSTVVNTFLGNSPDCLGVGELMTLTRPASDSTEYCSCGEPRDRCGFWGEVLDDWKRSCGAGSVRTYAQLQERYERFRRWPGLLATTRRPGSAFGDYSDLTVALYRSISAISGQPVVADSSKYPARAYSLSLMPEVDLRLIHLVRDPRAVAWSLRKRFKKDPKAGIQRNIPSRPAFQTALYWLLTSLQAEFVISRVGDGRSINLRYEDFLADPVATGGMISRLSDLDMSTVARQCVSSSLARMPHAVAGNRLRMSPKVVLHPDFEWRELMPLGDRRAVERVGTLMMRLYGYRRS